LISSAKLAGSQWFGAAFYYQRSRDCFCFRFGISCQRFSKEQRFGDAKIYATIWVSTVLVIILLIPLTISACVLFDRQKRPA
jgi:hypothetical protein